MVAVDYFTKWVEAEPLATITSNKLKDFVYKNIVCRFGIPHTLISDNGTQFANDDFQKFCDDLGIKKLFSSVARPQANGQVEAVNKTIKHTLKAKLSERKGAWVEELPEVLSAYRTTPRTSTNETPFSLAYGCEAMVPIELGAGSLRRETFNSEDNEALMRTSFDLVKELRDKAQLRLVMRKITHA